MPLHELCTAENGVARGHHFVNSLVGSDELEKIEGLDPPVSLVLPRAPGLVSASCLEPECFRVLYPR
jgi:hypothetical protein